MDGDPSFNLKQSCAAVNQGLALKNITATERTWLEAAATRCPDFADPSRYIRAMHDLAAKYPDDLDAQTLYADALMVPVRWRWYTPDGKPAAGVTEAEHLLEAVMRRYPNHAGANHLYIHAVESSLTPERAVASAQRLMGIVPSEGHMVHMPGHIWLVLGDFENAVSVNERAVLADQKYLSESGVNGSYYMYYLHNINFILYGRAMQGRLAATKAAEKQMAEAVAPMTKTMPEMAGVFDATIKMAQLRMYQWDDLLGLPHPQSKDPLLITWWRYSRAMAMAGKGRFEDARRERDDFESSRKALDPKSPWGQNTTGDVMLLASAVLEARMQNSAAAAVPLWKRAVSVQDGLTYDEPPAWYYPIRESLGAALLLAGDPAAAEAVFHEGLRRGPNNGRMLFGLLESLQTQHNTQAASEVKKEFQRAWSGSDITLRLADL
jgi:tetratricopeptide (TPR) repeat protein